MNIKQKKVKQTKINNDIFIIIALLSCILISLLRYTVNYYEINRSILGVIIFLIIEVSIIVVIIKKTKTFIPNTQIFNTKNTINFLLAIFIGFILKYLIDSIYMYLTPNFINQNSENLIQIDQIALDSGYPFRFITRIVQAPFCEEFLYRFVPFVAMQYVISLVPNDLDTKKSKISNSLLAFFYIVITSMMFSNGHLANNWQTKVLFFIDGSILCICFLLTRNIYVSISIHMLNNIVSYFDSSFQLNIILFLLCLTIILIVIRYNLRNISVD